MNNNIQVIIKSSTAEMSLNDHEAGIYIVPELNGLTGLPNIRTTSGVNAGYDGGWTTAQNYDARSIILRGTIANEDKSKVEQMRKQLVSLLGQGKKEPLTFDIVTETGKAYELQVRTIACDMAMQRVLTRQDFMITFRADDPLIYDNSAAGEPVTIQVQKALGGFQIDFELPLAIGGSEDAAIVENNGQEEVFPIVKMYGALHNPTIINQTTNQQMQLDVDLGYAEGAPIDPASVSGNPITITDAVDAPLADYEILGNTEQKTYTGKNLFQVTATSPSVSSGVTYTKISDTSFSIKSDGTASWARADIALPQALATNTTYTFKVNFTSTNASITSIRASFRTDSAEASTFTFTNGQSARLSTGSNTITTIRLYISTNTAYSGTVNFTNAQLESGSSATSYEPYVGGKASPNPDYPQAVRTVTGENVVKICGKNLFDKTAATLNYRIGSDGSPYGDNSFFLSDFIPVKPNTEYRITPTNGYNTSALAYYDSSKTFISRTMGGTWYNVSTPANAAYIRFATNKGYTETAQCELGNQATAYEAFRSQSYGINFDLEHGKNMLDPSTLVDGYISVNGEYNTAHTNDEMRSGMIAVSPNTAYTFSIQATSGTYDPWFGVGEYTSDNVASFVRRDTNNAAGATSITFTTSATTNYIAVSARNMKTATKVQLEQGSSATTYEPWSPLELCKIGTYRDYIYNSGSKWYVHKAVGKYTFTGSEVVGKAGNTNNNSFYYASSQNVGTFGFSDIDTSSMGTGTGSTVVMPIWSSHFDKKSPYAVITSDTTGISFNKSGSAIDCRLGFGLSSSVNTAQLLTTWLTENTPSVDYPLATPTYTEITNASLIEQLDALWNARTQNGVTNISLTPAGGATGSLDVTYYTGKNPDIRDEVIIDSRLRTITLNGTDIYSLQTEGSEFLMLAPGQNRLLLRSDNTSDNGYAEVNYKQGYLSI